MGLEGDGFGDGAGGIGHGGKGKMIIISQAQPATLLVHPFWVISSSEIPPLTSSSSKTDNSSIENKFNVFITQNVKFMPLLQLIGFSSFNQKV